MAEKRKTPLAGESAGKRFCQAFRRESACERLLRPVGPEPRRAGV